VKARGSGYDAGVPPATPSSDPRLCPLCGLANSCAMEQQRATGEAQPPCWCTNVDFDAALLARVPAESHGLACICPACARAAG
jgi:hypothetical protein